jgi:predicted flap endonuclease-1-like 5' DNA nuclease
VKALALLYQEGPDTGLTWLLLVVLGLFLVIVVVGWLVSRNRGAQATVRHEAHAEPEMPVVQEKSADDLTMIEGIGPKVSRVLNDAGIMSFADLAAADAARVERALDEAGLQMMDPEGWIEQAKLAARGDMEGLNKLQEELKGGRKAN